MTRVGEMWSRDCLGSGAEDAKGGSQRLLEVFQLRLGLFHIEPGEKLFLVRLHEHYT